jgi:hypothetical protein
MPHAEQGRHFWRNALDSEGMRMEGCRRLHLPSVCDRFQPIASLARQTGSTFDLRERSCRLTWPTVPKDLLQPSRVQIYPSPPPGSITLILAAAGIAGYAWNTLKP